MPGRRSHAAVEMDTKVSRKSFLRYGLMVTAAAFGGGRLFAQAPAPSVSPGAPPVVPDRGPQIESGLVKQFVIAGHSNLDKVKEMLAAQPALINAAWDWGGGSLRTTRSAAPRTLRPARHQRFLPQESNARMDLFAAAMLSHRHHSAAPKHFARAGSSQNSAHPYAEKGGADSVVVVEFLRARASRVIERGNRRQSVENPTPVAPVIPLAFP